MLVPQNHISLKANRQSQVSSQPAGRPNRRRAILGKAVFAGLLVALIAAACSPDNSSTLVDPTDVDPSLTAPPIVTITTVPLTQDTASPGPIPDPGNPTQPTAETVAPTEPAAPNQPAAPTTDPPVAPDPEQPETPTPTTAAPPATPQIPQLQRTGVASPYGGSFSVTVLVANGNEQRRVPIYDSPGGTEINLPDGGLWYRSYYGGPLVMEVIEGTQSDAWVRVKAAARSRATDGTCQVGSPCYGNDTTGWVQNSGYDWRTHQYHARIDLTERSVRVWNGSQIVAETLAVVGRGADTGNQAPTPVGTFFLKEKLLGESPGYGPYVLSLSGYSEWLYQFDGKLPNIAIHGTNRPQYIGQARSSGCIRVPNNIITTLYEQAPLGTIVEIVA